MDVVCQSTNQIHDSTLALHLLEKTFALQHSKHTKDHSKNWSQPLKLYSIQQREYLKTILTVCLKILFYK